MSQKLQYALDTNLFVSLAISIGGPERIAMLELIHDKGELVVFQYVLDELARHIQNAKRFPDEEVRHRMQNVVDIIKKAQLPIIPTTTVDRYNLSSLMRDKKDLPILLTAVESQTDFLLSKDDDFNSIRLKLPTDKPVIMREDDFRYAYPEQMAEYIEFYNDEEIGETFLFSRSALTK